jgi:hypothetical protein
MRSSEMNGKSTTRKRKRKERKAIDHDRRLKRRSKREINIEKGMI